MVGVQVISYLLSGFFPFRCSLAFTAWTSRTKARFWSRDHPVWTESEQNKIIKVDKWTMASCLRPQFSRTCMFKFITSLDFCFPTIFILLVSLIFQILSYSENFVRLKISSYSVTFVSKDSALSFSVASKTLNPKGLIAKKIRLNLERTPHWKHLNEYLEVTWIENPVRKAISALKTRKPTHRFTRRPNF